MRYRGGGVGHLATRQCNKTLLADEHTLLAQSEEIGDTLHESIGDQDSETEDEDRAESEGDEDRMDLIAGVTNDLDIVTLAGFAAL